MATRIVLGIVSAILASTISILSTASDSRAKIWGAALGLALTATALCCYALVEIRSLRKQVMVADARTQALTAALHHLLVRREESSPAGRQDRNRVNSHRPTPRRPPWPIPPSEPGGLLSEEFRVYLQGRRSRYDDDLDMPY
jgi:hypothetical protein